MKKMITKTLVCCLALLVTLCQMPAHTAASNPLAARKPPEVHVGTIEVSNKYVDIQLEYPVVSGMEDAVFQALFNINVKKDVDRLASELELDAKSEYGAAAAAGYHYLKHTLSSAVATMRNDGTLLSFAVWMETYTGGAHPNSDARFYTLLNKAEGRQLTLMQLFSDPAQGKTRVDKFINKAIAEQAEDYFTGATASVGDSTWFYVTKTTLCVVFPSYSIAPYVAGEPEFEVPLASIKDILIPGIY